MAKSFSSASFDPSMGLGNTNSDISSHYSWLEVNAKQSSEHLNCPKSTPRKFCFKNTRNYKLPKPKVAVPPHFPIQLQWCFPSFTTSLNLQVLLAVKTSSCVIYSSFYAGNHHPHKCHLCSLLGLHQGGESNKMHHGGGVVLQGCSH